MSRTSFLTRPALALLLALPGCGGGGGETDDPETTGTGTTGATPGTDTDEPTGGTTGEPGELGSRASQDCRDAMVAAAAFLDATAAGDAAAATTAYADLKPYVAKLDAAEGRSDDAAITDALAKGDAPGAALAEGHLYTSFARHLRTNIAAPETGGDDKYALWDEGYCLWDGALRRLAQAGDAVTWTMIDESIEADIDAAFEAGRAAITGEPPATTIDDWGFPPAKQIAEKSLFRAAQRVIAENAGAAHGLKDATFAARALGVFGVVRDRLEERNTPGIEILETMLAGDPANIDPMAVIIELDIAFAKRTRNYADQALAEGLGSPPGYKGAVEGGTYAKLIVAGMAFTDPMFDVAAYLNTWDTYATAVREGDEAGATAASAVLVEQTCAYQTKLGIAACTGSEDET